MTSAAPMAAPKSPTIFSMNFWSVASSTGMATPPVADGIVMDAALPLAAVLVSVDRRVQKLGTSRVCVKQAGAEDPRSYGAELNLSMAQSSESVVRSAAGG